jgi:membrane-associated phospholipid phosphatase
MVQRVSLALAGLIFVASPSLTLAQDTTARTIMATPSGREALEAAPVPAAEPTPATGGGFIASIGGDVRRLFSVSNARVAVVFGAAALGAAHWDGPVTQEAREIRPGLLNSGNTAGALWTQLGAGLVTLAIGKTTRQPQIAELGSDLLQAQLVSQFLVQGLKLATERTRPDASNHFSLPSGHTASAFAAATVLERRFGWKVGIPAYALGGYVATARIASNKHYLSDVIIGAGIGVIAGRAVTVGSGKTKFDLGFAPTSGGAALTFTKRK